MEQTAFNQISWDKPYYYSNSKPFIPQVFDGILSSADHFFNGVTIPLDGRLQADLTWKEARIQAQENIEKGYALLWEINLGFFSQLNFPLTNRTQYLALGLSLEHFRDTLWKEFQPYSLGLVLYRGNADFSDRFSWNEQQEANLCDWLQDRFTSIKVLEDQTQLCFSDFNRVDKLSLGKSEYGQQLIRLFCRDVAVEYMTLVASCLPDTLPKYLMLDATSISNPLWQAQLLHPERFDQWNLAIKQAKIPLQAWGWESSSMYGVIAKQSIEKLSHSKIVVGVCLPSMDMNHHSHYEGVEEALNLLLTKQIPFRLIPESHLITDWDGLDYLLYVPNGLSPQGKRKLQGFCAAGGTVVTLGVQLGLPYEVSLSTFIQNDC